MRMMSSYRWLFLQMLAVCVSKQREDRLILYRFCSSNQCSKADSLYKLDLLSADLLQMFCSRVVSLESYENKESIRNRSKNPNAPNSFSLTNKINSLEIRQKSCVLASLSPAAPNRTTAESDDNNSTNINRNFFGNNLTSCFLEL